MMIPPSPTFPQQLGELGALADEQADDAHARGGQTGASRLHESKQRLDREITSHLTSLEVLGGDIQLVRFKDHFGLDIQAVHTRVDGKRVFAASRTGVRPQRMHVLARDGGSRTGGPRHDGASASSRARTAG